MLKTNLAHSVHLAMNNEAFPAPHPTFHQHRELLRLAERLDITTYFHPFQMASGHDPTQPGAHPGEGGLGLEGSTPVGGEKRGDR